LVLVELADDGDGVAELDAFGGLEGCRARDEVFADLGGGAGGLLVYVAVERLK
jgi:hypothetical protein